MLPFRCRRHDRDASTGPTARPRPRRRAPAPAWEECEARTLLALSITPVVNVDRPASGTADAQFVVTLNPPNFEQQVTVDFATADGTARAGVDYLAEQGTLTFNPDEVTHTIDVPVLGNPLFVPNRSFLVELSNPVNATIAPGGGVGLGTIVNTLPVPALSIGDATATVGAAATTAVFTVALSAPSGVDTTVPFATADGTAHAGVDYQAASGVLDFPSGVTTRTVAVTVAPNTAVGPNTTFFVNLGAPTNANLARGQAVGTIVNPNRGGLLQFGAPSYTVRGDAGSATVTVTRTDGLASGVNVAYIARGGTAVPGLDYTPVSGVLAFGAGETTKTFAVPILPNLLLGPDKTVGLALFGPTGGGAIGPRGTAVLTIADVNSLVVTNTNDGGPGSLRQAILTANANPGTNTVSFAIPGAGPFTIAPISPLPTVTDPISLDGTTQPGFSGRPLVLLDGVRAGAGADGLRIAAGDSLVRGLAIGRFDNDGILLEDAGGDRVEGNFLGTDASGARALGNGQDGVTVDGTPGNTVGGTAPGARNVISGNGNVGVRLAGAGATGNVVEGDWIGTDAGGAAPLGNVHDGVFLIDAPGNLIGGTAPGARNVISGNGGVGVQVLDASAGDNAIVGNFVGTDPSGTLGLANASDGLYLNGAPRTTVLDNLISGNAAVGLQITGASATGNLVQGNRIGTDVAGTGRLGNGSDGIFVEGAPGNVLGGTTPGTGNLISANALTGIRLSGPGATRNVVLGDRIGTDLFGARALGNATDGVFVTGAPGNTIGGTAPGAGNLVSGNGSVGVQVFGAGATGNVVQGNFVGTDLLGLSPLGNLRDGVFLNVAPGNTVGGTTPGAGNLISANGDVGLQILGPGAAGNVVQGDDIGTDVDGNPRLGNRFGLFLNHAPGNLIGGPGAARNLIAGNTSANVIPATASAARVASPTARLLARRQLVPKPRA